MGSMGPREIGLVLDDRNMFNTHNKVEQCFYLIVFVGCNLLAILVSHCRVPFIASGYHHHRALSVFVLYYRHPQTKGLAHTNGLGTHTRTDNATLMVENKSTINDHSAHSMFERQTIRSH